LTRSMVCQRQARTPQVAIPETRRSAIPMSENIGAIAAIAAALCWTVSALCWTTAGRRVGSLVTNAVRLVVALPLLMLCCWAIDGSPVPLGASRAAWGWIALSGVVGFFLCDLCLFQSLLMIGTRLALLIFSLAPLVSSLFGWMWLGERLSGQDMAGMAIALGGVAWVVAESPRHDEKAPPRRLRWLGVVLATLAMFSQGVASVIAKAGLIEFPSAVAATEIRVMAGLVCFAVLMPALGRHRQCVEVLTDRRTMPVIVGGAIAGPVVGVALLMYSFTKIPTGLAMTFASLMPVMVIPFLIFLYKERVSARAILGAVVACAGLALLLWQPPTPPVDPRDETRAPSALTAPRGNPRIAPRAAP